MKRHELMATISSASVRSIRSTVTGTPSNSVSNGRLRLSPIMVRNPVGRLDRLLFEKRLRAYRAIGYGREDLPPSIEPALDRRIEYDQEALRQFEAEVNGA